MDAWVRKFRAMRRSGLEITTPVDHSDRAADNIGFVLDMKRRGKRLEVVQQAIGEDACRIALRNRCSLLIDPNVVDERGRRWGEAVVHNAYTPKPVVSGQGEFIPLAASRAAVRGVPVLVLSKTKEQRMPLLTKLNRKQRLTLRRALGLKKDESLKESDILPTLIRQIGKGKLVVANGKKKTKTAEQHADADADADDSDDEDELEPEDDDDDASDDDTSDDDADDTSDDDADEDELEDDDGGDAGADQEDADDTSRTSKRDREPVGALSAANALLLKRAIKTERRECIRRGALTPDVDAELKRIFMPGGTPSKLALSLTAGSTDPLIFRVYEALKRNKPVPMKERTGSQEAIALARGVTRAENPFGLKRNSKEIQRVIDDTRAWAKRMNGHRRQGRRAKNRV